MAARTPPQPAEACAAGSTQVTPRAALVTDVQLYDDQVATILDGKAMLHQLGRATSDPAPGTALMNAAARRSWRGHALRLIIAGDEMTSTNAAPAAGC